MKNPLGVSPSKGNQGTTQVKEKILLTSLGIKPTTSGLDLPLLCRLSYEVGQRKSRTILGGELRRRESKGTSTSFPESLAPGGEMRDPGNEVEGTYECCAA